MDNIFKAIYSNDIKWIESKIKDGFDINNEDSILYGYSSNYYPHLLICIKMSLIYTFAIGGSAISSRRFIYKTR